MRILQICPKPPVPPVDGGALAMNAMTEGFLDAGLSVKVLAIATKKHPFLSDKISSEYKTATRIESVFIDTSVKAFPAFLNLFSSSSYNIDRFYSLEFENKLKSILEKESFDIIQLESLFMCPYLKVIREFSKAKIILRAHNVESELWKRRATEEKSLIKKKWFEILAKKIHKYEQESLKKVDGIIPISNEDNAIFLKMISGKKLTSCVLPYAMKLPEFSPMSIPGRKWETVFHIGAMDWEPNIEGVKWLINEVWPKVIAEIPTAELHLAGKNLEINDSQFSGPKIINHGQVENAMEFMDQYSVMVIPLHSGSGMRIKMIEAMFLGKAIVTTEIGAEGSGVINGVHALIENSATNFAKAICRALTEKNPPPLNALEPYLAGTLAKNGKKFSHQFDSIFVRNKLIDFYTTLLK